MHEILSDKHLVDLDHFLITRFVVSHGPENRLPDREWLDGRIELFSKYCLPSVSGQDTRKFRWLILADESVIDYLRCKLDITRKQTDLDIELCPIRGEFDDQKVAEIVGRRRRRGGRLLTTRLDNDDMIASNFMTMVRETAMSGAERFINVVNGGVYSSGEVYLRPYFQNPFISLLGSNQKDDFSPTARPERTVYFTAHNKASRALPIQNRYTSRPMWLQVVHGGNVANQIVGVRLYSRSGIRSSFPSTAFPNLPPVTPAKVVADGGRVIHRLSRTLLNRITLQLTHGSRSR